MSTDGGAAARIEPESGDAVLSSLHDALKVLSQASLPSAHEQVKIIRGHASDAGDSEKEDNAAAIATLAEPLINTRGDLKAWRTWAIDKAKTNAEAVRPRRTLADGSTEPLPVLGATPNEVLVALGIVPALYLDFLKFCFGFCVLGALQASLSLAFNAMHADEAYDDTVLSNAPGQGFLELSIGARTACHTESCKTVNLISAILEVLFSLLLLLASKSFQSRVARLAEMNDADNVYTREYAVQLHGLPKDVKPEEVKEHIEGVLSRETMLSPSECKVWDVALIMNASVVLKNAVKQAPLERKWAILSKRLQTLLSFKEEKHTGWDLSQKIHAARNACSECATDLIKVRAKMAKKGFQQITTVCGAFVTFEEQAAVEEMRRLYRGGLGYALQKPEIRFRGRRLRAYAATQPRDVLHENLPHRILAFNLRGLKTLFRRLISATILSVFLLTSFAFILAVNSVKNDLRADLLVEVSSGEVDGEAPAISPDLIAAADTAFPTLASLIVVGVNVAISILVSALGKFGRYPTLSAMQTSKVTTIFQTTVFNTAVLPLVVSMAPPPRAYVGAYSDACTCSGELICCAFGPHGVLARGDYFTMSHGWHRDVGVLITGSLFFQTVSACLTPLIPFVLDCVKRKLKTKSVVHRFDMEALYEGPPVDLPKFIGKAYAFFFVTMMFSAVLPVLYIIGAVFFLGVWIVERFALLRVHQTPPPYSHELILHTIGWMPWLVCAHLGLAFWGYASLPAMTLDGAPFEAPFGNATLSSLLVLRSSGAEEASSGSALAAFAGANAAVGEASNALEYIYDLSGHASASWAAFILFVPAFVITAVLVWLLLVPDAMERCIKRHVAKLFCRGKAQSQVSPGGASGSVPQKVLAAVAGEDALTSAAPVPAPAAADEAPQSAKATPAGFAADPSFSAVLQGVERDGVRMLNGKLVHEFQLSLTVSKWARCARFMPDTLLFRMLRMDDRTAPVTKAQWEAGTKVFTRLQRAADISYQPQWHPQFEKAFVYLAAEPKTVTDFMSQEAAAKEARKQALAAIPDDFLEEEETEEGEEEEEEEGEEDKK